MTIALLRSSLFVGVFSAFLSTLCTAETLDVQVIYPDQTSHNHIDATAPSDSTLLAQAEPSISLQHAETIHADTHAPNHQLIDVDQLIDMESLDPSEVFRFAPDYLELMPGDTLRFMNSLGKHTVLSIKSMMPEGAKPFSIAHQKVAEVTFDQPGVYGIRCKVHTRYGMVMLVKVGNELTNLETAKQVKISKRAKKKFNKLFQQLEASL